jgi:hypothetical protein
MRGDKLINELRFESMLNRRNKRYLKDWVEQIRRKFRTSVALKNIITFCLSFMVLIPVAWLFGIVKPALIIAFTAVIIKISTGDLILVSPLHYAVAVTFTVTVISFLSILFPITIIAEVIFIMA